jgi:hypothetical protein
MSGDCGLADERLDEAELFPGRAGTRRWIGAADGQMHALDALWTRAPGAWQNAKVCQEPPLPTGLYRGGLLAKEKLEDMKIQPDRSVLNAKLEM